MSKVTLTFEAKAALGRDRLIALANVVLQALRLGGIEFDDLAVSEPEEKDAADA